MRTHAADAEGFTLVELLVVMFMALFVLAAANRVMISMTRDFKQQTNISQKAIESGFGLELMRRDISAAGYGLPTGLKNAGSIYYDVAYFEGALPEATAELIDAEVPGSNFDSPNAPKMLDASVPAITPTSSYALNGSSYLVIRSAAVGPDKAAGKFYILKTHEGKVLNSSDWDAEGLLDEYRDPRLPDNAKAIVVSPEDFRNLGLLHDGSTFYTTRATVKDYLGSTKKDMSAFFKNPEPQHFNIMYGISSDPAVTNLRAPFNRVDYYVSRTGTPEHCAKGVTDNTGAGVLYRAVMNHADGKIYENKSKLLDCVAAMKVIFVLDTITESPREYTPNVWEDDLTGYTAKNIRDWLQWVEVYVLLQEGQFDPDFEYDDSSHPGKIMVGTLDFDAANLIGTTPTVKGVPYWKHFRWRVLKIVERPKVMRIYED